MITYPILSKKSIGIMAPSFGVSSENHQVLNLAIER